MSEIQYKHCNSVGLDQLGLDFWHSRCPFFLIFPCGEIPYILYNLHYEAQVDLEISWSQNISWIRRSDTQLRCPLLKEPKDNMEIIHNGNGCRTLSITLHSKCNHVFCRKCPSRLNLFSRRPIFSNKICWFGEQTYRVVHKTLYWMRPEDLPWLTDRKVWYD